MEKLRNTYRLWQVKAFNYNGQSYGVDSLYGLGVGLKAIWDHQHPANCSNSTFLIGSRWVFSGFGSEVHCEGAAMGLAMSIGRIYLQHPYPYHRWQTDLDFCRAQNKKNLECYFEPWSSCTIFDALGPQALEILRFHNDNGQIPCLTRMSPGIGCLKARRTMIGEALKGNFSMFLRAAGHEKTVLLRNIGALWHGFVPPQFINIVKCSPFKKTFYYYWWRALSASYILRPNGKTLKWLEDNSLYRNLSSDNPPVIGVYVRRGQKSSEMRLLPFSEYINATEFLWKGFPEFLKPDKLWTKSVFFATEDPGVLHEAILWASASQVNLLYTDLFERNGTAAASANGEGTHHGLEYLSMLLNIDHLLQSSAWVCTLASNFCRLVDELRTTVSPLLTRPFVDISPETCNLSPCVGDGVFDLQWR